MSAQLSRCVAVYSRHIVASRINAPAVVFTLAHFVTTQKTMWWAKSLLDRLWSPTPASGRRSRPSVALRCTSAFWQVATALESRLLPAVSRAHTTRDVDRLSSGVRPEGEAVISRPVVRGPMAIALPRSRSPVPSPGRFGHTTAGYVDRPQAGWGPVIGRWSPLPLRAPAGDPTPIAQVKVHTRAKSITGFSLSKPVPSFKTGYRFSGSRLTSLFIMCIEFMFLFHCRALIWQMAGHAQIIILDSDEEELEPPATVSTVLMYSV